MAPHSSTLAWKIPWTEEPGRLKSKGLLRVGHDSVTSLSLFTFMHWRRKWQPTPVFLPGESQGWGSLVGCRLWGHTESDTTEATQLSMCLMEKAMSAHSSSLAWKIPWMEEPGRLQSMGLLRVGHDSVTSLSLFTFMHWRRKWQPNPGFLLGESQGRGSLVGCHLWGRTELDKTDATQQQFCLVTDYVISSSNNYLFCLEFYNYVSESGLECCQCLNTRAVFSKFEGLHLQL